MKQVSSLRALLKQSISVPKKRRAVFFKTGIGDYAAHDQFMGVKVPILRKISRQFQELAFDELQVLIESPFNEERLIALFILVSKYQTGDLKQKASIYRYYIKHLQQVNNWNLVDASAHLIVGAHLLNKNRNILLRLARSPSLWERRVAIVSTWFFIRHDDFEWTFKLARMLLNDQQDLMHKAAGWMLREAGKRNQKELISFLEDYAQCMPRTMLRYAIEKFPEAQRKKYLMKKTRG